MVLSLLLEGRRAFTRHDETPEEKSSVEVHFFRGRPEVACFPSVDRPLRRGHRRDVSAELLQLDAARAGDQTAFRDLVDPHRRGLLAHCYRMCGSIQEAEDVVQEAMLRAFSRLETFEGRSSFRGWIYRIATNAALDSLRRTKPRTLPALYGPPAEPEAPLSAPVTEPVWLEPFPDALLPDEVPSPDALLTQKESVRFAFLQALQRLPATQRAAVLLKDVIGASAAEIAELLETSVPAVNSLIERARDTLSGAPPPKRPGPGELEVVEAYVRAFESADVDALVTLLREDAALSMPPVPSWYEGRHAIGEWLRQNVLSPDAAGRFRGEVTRANGTVAAALRGPDGALVGVHVVSVESGQIADVVAFLDPAVLRYFEPR
jgi:RNA polymerase sigma-70 factor (ECF subfamily)